MPLFDDIQTVLTAAAYYVREKSPEMDEREQTLKLIRATLEGWIPDALPVGDETESLEVEIGGRRGGVSPVPWVRVFSPRYSPRATEGFYLVYLFAGDGSRVYLSLNQGTSEFRSNAMRPIRNEPVLLDRSGAARQLFDEWSSESLQGLTPSIDLRVQELEVGDESKQRSHNYELANVYAIPYDADTPVSDETLRSDLVRMLDLLATVYVGSTSLDYPFGESDLVVAPGHGSGQVRVSDARLRNALEVHSMAVVISLYSETGEWEIRDVSRYRPYDIHLRRKSDDHEVHVEVKGTRSLGEAVFLTKNEVDAASESEHTVLAVVHSIHVSYEDDELVCSGGQLTVHDPWTPADEDLTALQYRYRVPPTDT